MTDRTSTELLPPVPYEDWVDTRETLHRFAQIVGKVRLAHAPRRNHWWNVPFHLTGRGITTRPMGLDPTFAVDFDFLAHRLELNAATGAQASFSLLDRSVATFHEELRRGLELVGVPDGSIRGQGPFDLPDADRPFADDTEHATYDPYAVTRYWRVLSQVNLLLEEFAGRYAGKTSPVHHFWHTFDLAMTRFSDRVVEHAEGTDPVTREAYSREVVSFGFWFGDPTVPEPAFYAYAAPEPAGLGEAALPHGARWESRGASHLAVLPYGAAREASDRHGAVLDFWEAAYRAAGERAGWDVAGYRCHPTGVTDPVLRAATTRARG